MSRVVLVTGGAGGQQLAQHGRRHVIGRAWQQPAVLAAAADLNC